MQNSRNAFSLVELSIVLVILGLLTGGILAGQSLIRAAELRSVTSDFSRYQASLYAFRDKYFYLPGDMPNATRFWGVAAGDGTGIDNACYSFASTTSATCNGNGSGNIALSGTNGLGESHRAWQQLANAGLIEGSYNGQDVPCIIGTQCPSGRIANTGFGIFYSVYGASFGETHSANSNGNQIYFGRMLTGSGLPRAVALKPEEAWNIDTKLDDGKPDAGAVQTDVAYSANCFTGSYPNAVYALSLTSIQCSLRLTLR